MPMPATLPLDFPPDDYLVRTDTVRANHDAVERLMAARGIDVLVVTSQDPCLSEFTPRTNNQRYALSGFDGSTGNGVYVAARLREALGCSAGFVLFVDGRYHIQAERQTDPALVQVEKLPLGVRIWEAMASWLGARAARIGRIGVDPSRISVVQRRTLDAALTNAAIEWISLERDELPAALALPGWHADRAIGHVADTVTGRRAADNLARLRAAIAERYGDTPACFATCAADDIAWLLNSRGYHLPHVSSHLGYLFVLPASVILYLPAECAAAPVALDEVPGLQVVRDDPGALLALLQAQAVGQLCYRGENVNGAVMQWQRRAWPNARRDSGFPAVEAMRARKTGAELDAIGRAFARSSAAIAQAMRFAKYGRPGERHSERDLADEIARGYREQGALAHSFGTIAAAGANAALMHYQDCDPERELREGELVLLDSGAYYEDGFATDCTRTVLRNASGRAAPAPWQKEIYTVVLKASLRGLHARVAAGTIGEEVDQLVRRVVRAHGYDYACGTGHGIGIHVHEGGTGFFPGARHAIGAGMVVTIEPGIYLADRGGVRLENVVVARDDGDGMVAFDNLVQVGYDWELVDPAMLDDTERAWLRDYELACRARGTEVTPCPLLDD